MKRNLALLFSLLLAPAAPAADAPAPSPDATNRISGGVGEGRSAVELPGGEQATVGDLLAIVFYARLKASRGGH